MGGTCLLCIPVCAPQEGGAQIYAYVCHCVIVLGGVPCCVWCALPKTVAWQFCIYYLYSLLPALYLLPSTLFPV